MEPVLIAVSIASALLGMIALATTLVSYWLWRRRLYEVEAKVDRAVSPNLDPAKILRSETGTPRIFYFLNVSEVMSLYNQLMTAESVAKNTEIETGSDRTIGVEADVYAVKPKFDTSKSSRIRMHFEPETDADRAMAAVEQRLLEKSEITAIDLGQEVSRRPLEPSLAELSRLSARTGFTVPEGLVQRLTEAWDEYQHMRGVDRLGTLRGYVAVETEYAIDTDETGDIILEASVKRGGQHAAVRVLCTQGGIRNAGRTAFRVGTRLKATCFGTVLRWDEEARILTILPLSVF